MIRFTAIAQEIIRKLIDLGRKADLREIRDVLRDNQALTDEEREGYLGHFDDLTKDVDLDDE